MCGFPPSRQLGTLNGAARLIGLTGHQMYKFLERQIIVTPGPEQLILGKRLAKQFVYFLVNL